MKHTGLIPSECGGRLQLGQQDVQLLPKGESADISFNVPQVSTIPSYLAVPFHERFVVRPLLRFRRSRSVTPAGECWNTMAD